LTTRTVTPAPLPPPLAARVLEKQARLAKVYDSDVLPLYGRRFGQLALRGLDLRPAAQVLEIACATGDLTLELADGGLVSILASDTPFMSRTETSGTHRRNGVFIARGPGTRSGAQVSGVSILDVAPLLLTALGLEIPADMEGKVPEGVFEPSWLGSRAVRTAPASAAQPEAEPQGEPQTEEAFFTKEDELKLAQRLRDLGYIE